MQHSPLDDEAPAPTPARSSEIHSEVERRQPDSSDESVAESAERAVTYTWEGLPERLLNILVSLHSHLLIPGVVAWSGSLDCSQ